MLRRTSMRDPTTAILDGDVDRLGNVVLDRLCYIGNATSPVSKNTVIFFNF
jgi:hypothetical protein